MEANCNQDEKLHDCFNMMEAKYEVELLKLKERKWKDIAASMAEALREKKYTAKACKERWESLEDGSALIPIELDDDLEHRRVLREARLAENQRRRAEQKAAVLWALGEKDRKLAARRAELAEKDRERQVEKARKQAEKDEEARIKAEQRAGLEKRRAEQRAIQEELKAYHQAQRDERNNADAMYQHFTGKKLNGRRDNNLIKGADDNIVYDSDADTEMADTVLGDDERESEMPDLTDAEEGSIAEPGNNVETMDATPTPSRSRRVTRSKSKHIAKSKKTKVTLETLINPRSIMSYGELDEVLSRRKLPVRGFDEPHAQVVARIAAADATEDSTKLRELLSGYFDYRKATQEILARRLQEYDAASSVLGQEGATALDPEFKRGYEGYQGKFAFALEE